MEQRSWVDEVERCLGLVMQFNQDPCAPWVDPDRWIRYYMDGAVRDEFRRRRDEMMEPQPPIMLTAPFGFPGSGTPNKPETLQSMVTRIEPHEGDQDPIARSNARMKAMWGAEADRIRQKYPAFDPEGDQVWSPKFVDSLLAAIEAKPLSAITVDAPMHEAMNKVTPSSHFRVGKDSDGFHLSGPNNFWLHATKRDVLDVAAEFLNGSLVEALKLRGELFEKLGLKP